MDETDRIRAYAGGSQTLERVADRARDYLLATNVQLGASYETSEVSGARVAAGTAAVARLVGAGEDEVVIGSSSTQLLQNLALAMRERFAPGDEVIITTCDHEANRGPWKRLAERGVVVKEWALDPDTQRLEPRGLEALLGPKTRLVAFTHASNLLGGLHDVAGLTRVAHAAGAEVRVDGVAYAPHRKIDVAAWDVDYYVFSFYKVYGPHMAVLYGKRALLHRLANINHDFIGDEIPYKLQPGHVNFELTWALGGIEEYVNALGGRDRAWDEIAAHEEALATRFLDYLGSKRGVRVHGDRSPDRARRVPTVSFTVDGREPEAIVRAVDPHRIGIRHGDFYARRLCEVLGLAPHGVVRVSAVHYNTLEEIDRLLLVLDAAIDGVKI